MLFHGVQGQHRVHRGNNTVQAVPDHQERISHQSVQDGRGVSQTGSFDDQAVEIGYFLLRAAGKETFQGINQFTPDGAAQTAAGHQHHIVFDAFHQHIVDAYLAEFINHDRRPVHAGMLYQTVQQGRLAAAQKAGNDRYGQAINFSLRHFHVPVARHQTLSATI